MQAGDPSVLNWMGEAAKHHAILRSPYSFVGHQGHLRLGKELLEMTDQPQWFASVSLPFNIRWSFSYAMGGILECAL
ncbi:hypothetical protein BDR03DRAFT_1068682, partial [Suillus americanus]